MSDRDAARPDGAAPHDPGAVPADPAPEQVQNPEEVRDAAPGPEPVQETAPERVQNTAPEPELVEHVEPPLEPVPDREPAPEPEAPATHDTGPIEIEPHTSVEAVAEPAAPAQVAPEPGAAPIPFEPEPSVPEPAEVQVALNSGADTGTDLGTADTLALPPTTAAVEPTPPVVSSAPPPPPTGVPVPFAAPPTERNGGRFALKLVLGIGGGTILVTAVVIALFMAFATFTNSVTDQIEATAGDFVAELADEDWDGAYAMLCPDMRERPADDYIAEWQSWDAASAEVQPLGYNELDVRVRLADGSQIALVVPVEQTAQTIGTSVCGWYTVED
ncbi:hypothetical protein [Glycomyces sp. NPDC047010]|uniref:hypothetical protein n=1 Tax=Glycomyces sp. NPDC047010 TaxID=3155023 RepID=UPI0033D201C9